MTLAVVCCLAIAASALNSLNTEAIAGPLVLLVLMVLFLYWTTTLLPGPVRKVGKAAGKALLGAVGNKKKGSKGH